MHDETHKLNENISKLSPEGKRVMYVLSQGLIKMYAQEDEAEAVGVEEAQPVFSEMPKILEFADKVRRYNKQFANNSAMQFPNWRAAEQAVGSTDEICHLLYRFVESRVSALDPANPSDVVLLKKLEQHTLMLYHTVGDFRPFVIDCMKTAPSLLFGSCTAKEIEGVLTLIEHAGSLDSLSLDKPKSAECVTLVSVYLAGRQDEMLRQNAGSNQ